MAKSDSTKALETLANKLAGVAVTELPAVTAADAGKVLTVSDEGKWVAAALPEDPAEATVSGS